jgi:hypothetical protein
VRRLGDARDTEAVSSRGARQAHLEGFDLHANVWVSARDRAVLERRQYSNEHDLQEELQPARDRGAHRTKSTRN